MKTNSFTRKEHLRKSSLIKDVFKKGVSFKRKSIVVFLLKKESASFHINRVAFISRKTLYNKKLVLRNTIRRLLREAYRRTKSLLPTSYDVVILATNVKKLTKSTILEKEMRDVFKECNKTLR